ncbi:hypothetical protein GE09DRAFT_1229196 [Coniochaeta sp. 2T2.1]|nr:hypothetical protein GE09DRAFT_1229196 [Coniochaeta sp. 2T2.1]
MIPMFVEDPIRKPAASGSSAGPLFKHILNLPREIKLQSWEDDLRNKLIRLISHIPKDKQPWTKPLVDVNAEGPAWFEALRQTYYTTCIKVPDSSINSGDRRNFPRWFLSRFTEHHFSAETIPDKTKAKTAGGKKSTQTHRGCVNKFINYSPQTSPYHIILFLRPEICTEEAENEEGRYRRKSRGRTWRACRRKGPRRRSRPEQAPANRTGPQPSPLPRPTRKRGATDAQDEEDGEPRRTKQIRVQSQMGEDAAESAAVFKKPVLVVLDALHVSMTSTGFSCCPDHVYIGSGTDLDDGVKDCLQDYVKQRFGQLPRRVLAVVRDGFKLASVGLLLLDPDPLR